MAPCSDDPGPVQNEVAPLGEKVEIGPGRRAPKCRASARLARPELLDQRSLLPLRKVRIDVGKATGILQSTITMVFFSGIKVRGIGLQCMADRLLVDKGLVSREPHGIFSR